MNAATASEIARLETLTITNVVEKFESLFGEKCLSRNGRYWIRRIARRLQANAEGNLSERARARAAELAIDSEVRVTPPRETIQPRLVTSDVQSRPALDQRLPPPGSMLHREYKGPANPGADRQQRVWIRRRVTQVPHGGRQRDHRLPRQRIPVLSPRKKFMKPTRKVNAKNRCALHT